MAASILKILFNLTLLSVMVSERILREITFRAESLIGTKLILFWSFWSGSSVKLDWGFDVCWGLIIKDLCLSTYPSLWKIRTFPPCYHRVLGTLPRTLIRSHKVRYILVHHFIWIQVCFNQKVKKFCNKNKRKNIKLSLVNPIPKAVVIDVFGSIPW